MPRCSICRKSVPGDDLGPVPNQITDKGPVLACSACRGLKAVPPTKAEKTMTKNSKTEQAQPLATLNIWELDNDDYRFDLNVKVGGVRIEVSKTVSEIRDFFTKRKDRRQASAGLKAVPKE
jgi:hypothetical protein